MLNANISTPNFGLADVAPDCLATQRQAIALLKNLVLESMLNISVRTIDLRLSLVHLLYFPRLSSCA